MKMDTGTAGVMAVLVGLLAFFLGRNNQQQAQIQGFSQPTAIQANQTTATTEINYTAKYKWNFTKDEGLAYIERFKDVAITEQKEFGIFASITLAQGLLETSAGKSKLVENCNNHFGLKCFDKYCKKGHCKNFTDDSHKDFFVNFPSAWNSYREHSNLLQKPRYKTVLAAKTPEKAAFELRRCGYATDSNYEKKIIDLINIFNLKKFDL